jgi:ADP-ribosyl-[dinitrogen reductase] hydrolase
MRNQNPSKDILFGLAVGDALGVPVEFKSRAEISRRPVTDMIGYGTYNLPPGTFSDDSSLAFCLAEALTQDFDLQKIADNFVRWLTKNYWTPRGHVFDVGIATREAIFRLKDGEAPEFAGGTGAMDNGNGSLMRILPLLLYIKDRPIDERYQLTRKVSSITHGHVRSSIACFYYLEFARHILAGLDKFTVYHQLQKEIKAYLQKLEMNPQEINIFKRLLDENIYELPEEDIASSGYVMHTLEASIWCILSTDNYRDAALKAVNLGSDTDTTGAVTGGLAGLIYGWENIPTAWINAMARKEDIEDLALRLEKVYG